MLYFQKYGLIFSSRTNRAQIPPQRDFSQLGRVAQLAEHSALNRQVEGSIPSASTIAINQLQQSLLSVFFNTGENTKDHALNFEPMRHRSRPF
jgi:hypothetical protein